MAQLVKKIKEWIYPTYFLVDMDDKFVLYMGRYEHCIDVMEHSYGGNFTIMTRNEIPEDVVLF